MANLCGECLKIDWDNKSSFAEKYFCKELKKYVSPGENGCSYYSYNNANNNKNNGGWKPCGFSWSVIFDKLGEILGMSNDSTYVESMNFFKNNILSSDELFDYSKNIIDNLFVPMMEYIKSDFIEEAKLTFQNFVEELKSTMGLTLNEEINKENNLVRRRLKPSEA